jgi:hypothetical protein
MQPVEQMSRRKPEFRALRRGRLGRFRFEARGAILEPTRPLEAFTLTSRPAEIACFPRTLEIAAFTRFSELAAFAAGRTIAEAAFAARGPFAIGFGAARRTIAEIRTVASGPIVEAPFAAGGAILEFARLSEFAAFAAGRTLAEPTFAGFCKAAFAAGFTRPILSARPPCGPIVGAAAGGPFAAFAAGGAIFIRAARGARAFAAEAAAASAVSELTAARSVTAAGTARPGLSRAAAFSASGARFG